jgi:hypothetical protein
MSRIRILRPRSETWLGRLGEGFDRMHGSVFSHWRLHDMKNDRRLHGKLMLGWKIPFFQGCSNLFTVLPGRFPCRAAGDKAAERISCSTRRWYDDNNIDSKYDCRQGAAGVLAVASITQRRNGRCQVVPRMGRDGTMTDRCWRQATVETWKVGRSSVSRGVEAR